MSEFTIKAVAQATGLTVETLRAWERRYQAVVPLRDDSGRRGYSPGDVNRLKLLKTATELGHPISKVAALPPQDLGLLVAQGSDQSPNVSRGEAFVERILAAAYRSDALGVEEALVTAMSLLPPQEVATCVIGPVVTRIGDAWHRGELSVAQEHMVTDIVRRLIANASRAYFVSDRAPNLVMTTLSGERHELGILLCQWLAAVRRCRTHYLGPDTPVDDIVTFAQDVQADAVLVSMVMSENEIPAQRQFRQLVEKLQPDTQVWLGGRAAQTMAQTQLPVGAVLMPTLGDFEQRLELLLAR